MKKYILLIRHPESTKNIFNKMGNSNAFQLSGKGRKQAYRISDIINEKFLNYCNSELLFGCSGEQRCRIAAAIISQKLAIKSIEVDFKPIKIGLLNGLTRDDARIKFPLVMKKEEMYFNNELDGYSLVYPDGESIKEFQARIVTILLETLNIENKTHFIFILHQSMIAAIINYFKYRDDETPCYPFNKIDLCSFSEIVLSESQAKVNYINKQFI